MTVSSENRKAGPFSGNDIAATFPFAFRVFSATDIRVVRRGIDGAETDLVLDESYAVTLNEDQNATPGGDVLFVAPPATGVTIVITSRIPRTQEAEILNGGGFYPSVVTDALDRVVVAQQEMQEELSRSIRVPITSSDDPAGLTAAIVTLAAYADDIPSLAEDAQTALGAAALATDKALATAADRLATAADRLATESARDTATGAASTAAGAASTATTQAGIATTQAGLAATAKSGADSAQAAAELARDASFALGPKYTTEAAGRAAVADGEVFLVVGSGDVAAYEYRRTNGSASVLIATYPSKSAIDTLAASLSTTLYQTIGRPADPIDGTGAGNDTVVFADAVSASGTLATFKFYAKATGNLTIARYTKIGTSVTRVTSVTIAIASTGLKTLTSADFGTFPVVAGEYLSVYGPGIFTYIASTTADGAGWWPLTSVNTPPTGTTGTLVTTARVEAAWSIARQSQTVTASSVQAIADSLSAKADASTLYATVTQTIGRNVNPIDGTPAATGTFVQATPVSAACTLQTLLIYARATGTLTISKYSKSGITLTRTGVTTVTIASTGLKTLTSADFGTFVLAAGEYLSIAGSGIWTYTASTTADGDGWWQIANGATSATVGAAVTSARLELSAQFTRSEQVVTGPSFKTAQDIITRTAANQTSAAYPILLIADGNSLTAGQYSSPTYLWSSGAAASLGANSYNFGVPGQTTQQMTADAVSQIDPFALAAGVIPLVIAQELFNDIRVNSISAAQAVTNMATYCNARRAAGFKVGVCNLGDMEPTGGFTAGMVAAVNAELASRWWSFADFLVDMYAAGELKDRTNLTYYQADKVHCTNAGYAVMARQVRLAIRQWLMTL